MKITKGKRVEIGYDLAAVIERIGIDYRLVEETVLSSDDFENIVPDCSHRNWPIISLYSKSFSDGDNKFSLLVQAFKNRSEILVTAAWKIYPNTLVIPAIARLFDVFRAFLDKYGVFVQASHVRTKLVLYQTVSSWSTIEDNKVSRVFNWPEKVLGEGDHRVADSPEISSHEWAMPRDINMNIAILYNINMSNYLHDLSGNLISD